MSVAVIPVRLHTMSRWQPNAAERLERAALELYLERGFDQATVGEIARRAGLSERTFFRHYADKREVLFQKQSALLGLLADAVAAQPDSSSPLQAVAAAFVSAAPMFESRREQACRRQQVIADHPGLQERELIKLATIVDALGAALRARDVDPPAARLAAEAGVVVFKVAFDRWIADGAEDELGPLILRSFDELKTLTGNR